MNTSELRYSIQTEAGHCYVMSESVVRKTKTLSTDKLKTQHLKI